VQEFAFLVYTVLLFRRANSSRLLDVFKRWTYCKQIIRAFRLEITDTRRHAQVDLQLSCQHWTWINLLFKEQRDKIGTFFMILYLTWLSSLIPFCFHDLQQTVRRWQEGAGIRPGRNISSTPVLWVLLRSLIYRFVKTVQTESTWSAPYWAREMEMTVFLHVVLYIALTISSTSPLVSINPISEVLGDHLLAGCRT
jgi:hypothetical protein